ncbi:MAG: SAM-dependent methyltransferase [Clostridia bacterium]|nr:SAM-dependent methyltransferase [Clostridia bacterium]
MTASTNFITDNTIGLLAFTEQKYLLIEELTGRFGISENLITKAPQIGDLIFLPDDCGKLNLRENTPYWSRNTLFNPFQTEFASIGEAANILKQIQRNWAAYSTTNFRRSSLIQEKLPYINLKPRTFPVNIPSSELGMFTLLDNNNMIASAKTSSLFPCGKIEFVEDHENPPSRAYLKFQEALTNAMVHFGRIPSEGNRCFDAGACPGGWTWVLRQLGCNVLAVDRSELAPALMQDPAVQFMTHDAFTLPPEELGAFDWVCSDVICYPERLLKWIHKWLESGLCKNMICTIKMQGAIDWNLIQEFAAIPNSYIGHMNYNKHELTWIHCE